MEQADSPSRAASPGAPLEPPPSHPVMIDPDRALQLVLDAAGPPEADEVPLDAAAGLVLAEEVRADRDHPAFRRAMMDGYAVRVADAGATVEVVGELAAGDPPSRPVTQGQCVEIMTGAACPPGTEAVVQKEIVRRDGDRAILPPCIPLGTNIAPIGSECRAGTRLLSPGDPITPLAVALLAGCGAASVRVFRRPTLAVITTGSELVPPGQSPSPWQIRDTNGPMLAAMARTMGIERPLVLHAADNVPAIQAALERAADRDLVLLSGGVSAGNYDLVPDAIKRYGATVLFHKVTQKPGKPLLAAVKGRQLLFGLPGNPLACHLGFDRYAAAAIRQREGRPPLPEPVSGTLAAPLRWKGGRTFFLLARAQRSGPAAGDWSVAPLAGVSSADLFTPGRANCYLRLPPGQGEVPAGTTVPFTWIAGQP